ncbi:hypothetical protein AAEX28_09705 [Lentisphaerota bacterium WC36G]|nr:hypothetical protein LJT99_12540 [Lentisphaerae bacterium WC36]
MQIGEWSLLILWVLPLIITAILIHKKRMSKSCFLLPLLLNVIGLIIVIFLYYFHPKLSDNRKNWHEYKS